MAIQLSNISQIKGSLYSVTVTDTADIVGLDEKGANVYKTYSIRYNRETSEDLLVNRINEEIKARKNEIAGELAVETKVKVSVEAIDPTEITAG